MSAELTAAAARQLVLGAELVDADICRQFDVFDEIVAPEEVLSRGTERARELAALPTDVYARSKLDLGRAALEEMRAAAARDPLLEAWTEWPPSA